MTLASFTRKFVILMANTLESNENFRPEIEQLCDLELYQNMIKLPHVECALMAASFNLHRLVANEYRAIQESEASRHYLDMSEYENLRDGYIAKKLRAMLGYDSSQDMGSLITRQTCNDLIASM